MYTFPTGYTIYGISNNGNTITATKAASTTAKPRLMIVDRKEAVWNSQSGNFSTPTLRVRVIVGTVDGDGLPKPERLVYDCEFRTPVTSGADQEEAYDDLVALISHADFLIDGIKRHQFPTCCDTEEA